MNQVYDKLMRCYESIRENIPFQPEIALILGSGLGNYADGIQKVCEIDYGQIAEFPVSTVKGHKGSFVFGYVNQVPVVIMQGRVHYYEGYDIEDVVLPTRLMKLMGAKILLLTNASGGINRNFRAGDFMLITDHIASFVPNPLIGPNADELGERFSDMSHIYDEALREIVTDCAKRLEINLQKGVYLQLTGPAFESPAEVRMCSMLGADAVGMSTACEAIAANHMGMRVCGISCISNLACGLTEQPLSHEEVFETAAKAAPLFRSLITAVITEMGRKQPENVAMRKDGRAVIILDQSQLPQRKKFVMLRTPEEMFEAIFELRVRGAPAIGIFAAIGIAVLAKGYPEKDFDGFLEHFQMDMAYLNSSRPTAVNLNWALRRMESIITGNYNKSIFEIQNLLTREALKIQQEDVRMCEAISEYGLSLLKDGDGILTHCNAGPLATSLYGTGLGPLILGKERGLEFKVFADETRPLLQGARLTAYELSEAGLDVTLICDNMAGIVMKNGWIQACLVGCDRVAANGDTANKIGTSGVAVLAKHYGIPFYVLGPTSTIDLECRDGSEIEIELRSQDEIKTKFYESSVAPEKIKCYNPAFDVTDHSLITAIITENGICRAPFEESLREITLER